MIFQLFLEYLYSGQLALDTLTLEQIADLLTLSDRYEVSAGLDTE
jgi:hypothetical protein